MRRLGALLALASLFYFSRFPSLTFTDLVVITALVTVAIILGANYLVQLASGLIDEALSDKPDSFLSRFWSKYRAAGFNRHMTERAAKSVADVGCIKFGFDAIQVTAANVPLTAEYAWAIDWIGAAIVLGVVLWYGVWLKLAVDFRADERDRQHGRTQGATRIGMPRFWRLYYKPLTVFVLFLYAPELIRVVLGVTVRSIVASANAVFGSAELQAAQSAAQCIVY